MIWPGFERGADISVIEWGVNLGLRVRVQAKFSGALRLVHLPLRDCLRRNK